MKVNEEDAHRTQLPNYWDLGDKTAAEHFTRDFLQFLVPEVNIKGIKLLDKETIKEAFRSNLESDHVVELTLGDETRLGVLLEFQHYNDPEIWERLWEYSVLLKRKHGLTILPVLVDYNKERKEQAGEAVQWMKRPMMQLGLTSGRVDISTLTCLVFKVNRIKDIELLTRDQPGIWTLLPFSKTKMKPSEMLDVIARRLTELKIEQDYIRKIVTMLGYYLEGMYTPRELEEFNETIRRWQEMSIELKYVGEPWREEGRKIGREEGLQEGKQEALKEAIFDVLAERFGSVDPELQKKLTSITNLEQLKFLLKKSISIKSMADFESLI